MASVPFSDREIHPLHPHPQAKRRLTWERPWQRQHAADKLGFAPQYAEQHGRQCECTVCDQGGWRRADRLYSAHTPPMLPAIDDLDTIRRPASPQPAGNTTRAAIPVPATTRPTTPLMPREEQVHRRTYRPMFEDASGIWQLHRVEREVPARHYWKCQAHGCPEEYYPDPSQPIRFPISLRIYYRQGDSYRNEIAYACSDHCADQIERKVRFHAAEAAHAVAQRYFDRRAGE